MTTTRVLARGAGRGWLGVCLWGGMPFTRFSFKRLVLLAGKAARAFAALGQLTPARGDMMLAMLHQELSQTELVLALGVSKSVVSRMVQALEALGLVARRKPKEDRRVRLVSLTEAGRRTLDTYFDGWMAEDGKGSFQADAEGQMLETWRESLATTGLRVEVPTGDVGPVLRHIRSEQAGADYWADDFGIEEAKTMRCHRNMKHAPRLPTRRWGT